LVEEFSVSALLTKRPNRNALQSAGIAKERARGKPATTSKLDQEDFINWLEWFEPTRANHKIIVTALKTKQIWEVIDEILGGTLVVDANAVIGCNLFADLYMRARNIQEFFQLLNTEVRTSRGLRRG